MREANTTCLQTAALLNPINRHPHVNANSVGMRLRFSYGKGDLASLCCKNGGILSVLHVACRYSKCGPTLGFWMHPSVLVLVYKLGKLKMSDSATSWQ